MLQKAGQVIPKRELLGSHVQYPRPGTLGLTRTGHTRSRRDLWPKYSSGVQMMIMHNAARTNHQIRKGDIIGGELVEELLALLHKTSET